MKRTMSFLLAVVMMLSAMSAASAEAAGLAKKKTTAAEPPPPPEEIRISSLEQFLRFADDCTETAYSENRIFKLECNLDLSGTDFEPVPYFSGTFEGNGHRITGLNIDRGGSRRGLFRILSETARVSDLSVYGNVVPTGTRIYVGGIAGMNYGQIIGCSFEGTVEGVESIGGIAGLCGDKAIIQNCTFSGSVSGEHSVGGIAGSSTGSISSCTNRAEVNTKQVTPEKTGSVTLDSFDISAVAVDDFLDITDLGGICGNSGGLIASCTNSGNVGYFHTGYNVGGIAGTDSGYVSACINTGKILGRKDVGGIVGQKVPYVDLDYSEGKFDDVEKAIKSLNGQISNASAVASANGAAIDGELTNVTRVTDDFYNELKKLFDEYGQREDDIAGSIHYDPDTGDIVYDPLPEPDTSGLGNALRAMGEEYAALLKMVNSAVGETANALTNVAYSMSGVMNSLNNTLENTNFDIDEYEISVEEAYGHDRGAVASCINRGEVSAESCAGGIAGSVAYEVEFDREDLIDASHYIVSEVKRYIFAAIRDCESYGRIETKKDYAGGVVGRMDLGAVLNSTGAGYVTSLDGGCVGGIAGRSDGTLTKCFARPVLSGDGYVGGIVGNGNSILDCYVYAAFDSYGEYAGALAGWAEGEISNNWYVSCHPAGIDGISYTGKMYSVSYEELLKNENLPDVFREIKVRFIGPDGNVVRTDSMEFGGAVTDFPEIPVNGVQYWLWEWEGLDAVYHSVDVKGAWYNPVFTLATEEDVPRFLVEGAFYEGQELKVTETVSDSSDGSVRSSTVLVTDYEGKLTVRMFAEGSGKIRVYHKDGTQSDAPYATDGRYKVFEMENGESVSFEPTSVKKIAVEAIIGSAAFAGLLILLLILWRRKKKKSSGSNNETPETGTEPEDEGLPGFSEEKTAEPEKPDKIAENDGAPEDTEMKTE